MPPEERVFPSHHRRTPFQAWLLRNFFLGAAVAGLALCLFASYFALQSVPTLEQLQVVSGAVRGHHVREERANRKDTGERYKVLELLLEEQDEPLTLSSEKSGGFVLLVRAAELRATLSIWVRPGDTRILQAAEAEKLLVRYQDTSEWESQNIFYARVMAVVFLLLAGASCWFHLASRQAIARYLATGVTTPAGTLGGEREDRSGTERGKHQIASFLCTFTLILLVGATIPILYVCGLYAPGPDDLVRHEGEIIHVQHLLKQGEARGIELDLAGSARSFLVPGVGATELAGLEAQLTVGREVLLLARPPALVRGQELDATAWEITSGGETIVSTEDTSRRTLGKRRAARVVLALTLLVAVVRLALAFLPAGARGSR